MIANYDRVLNLARQLELEEQLKLLKALLGTISSDVSSDAAPKRSIMELKGLGSEVWQDVEVEEYIRQERNSCQRQ